MARRTRTRPPGPPYAKTDEAADIQGLITRASGWAAGDVLRQHPVIATDHLRLAKYAARLLPPRVVRGAS
jgi:hypothetical protein